MPYTQFTLATIRPRLKDLYEGGPFWSDEEARLGINEALKWWNLLTACWKVRVSIPTVAGQVWYPVPTGILYPLRIDLNNTPLFETSLFDMDLGRPNWEGDIATQFDPAFFDPVYFFTGSPVGGVPTRPTLWVPAGFTLFAIWPGDIPGSNSLIIDGIAPTPVLVSEADTFDLGNEEITILLGEALHLMAIKQGWAAFESTLPFHDLFINSALLKNQRLATSKTMRKLLGRGTKRDAVPGPAAGVPLA